MKVRAVIGTAIAGTAALTLAMLPANAESVKPAASPGSSAVSFKAKPNPEGAYDGQNLVVVNGKKKSVSHSRVTLDKPVNGRVIKVDGIPVRPQNDIRWDTDYKDCDNPSPEDTTGTMRLYVNHLIDFTPNPDKVRPVYFTTQNRFNHTARILNLQHYNPNANSPNWWITSQYVLSAPVAGAAHDFHQAGNYWQSGNVNGFGALPTRIQTGAQGFGGVDAYIYTDNVNHGYPPNTYRVSGWEPYDNPWWQPRNAFGPYFRMDYLVQSDTYACSVFYSTETGGVQP